MQAGKSWITLLEVLVFAARDLSRFEQIPKAAMLGEQLLRAEAQGPFCRRYCGDCADCGGCLILIRERAARRAPPWQDKFQRPYDYNSRLFTQHKSDDRKHPQKNATLAQSSFCNKYSPIMARVDSWRVLRRNSDARES